MWKDFLYFPKSQQVGIIVLITIILLTIATNQLLPYLFNKPDNTADSLVLLELDQFKKELAFRDSIALDAKRKKEIAREERQKEWELRQLKRAQPGSEKKSKKEQAISLFTFDPNTADSTDFIRLGLSPHTVSNILKFRRKNGVYKNAEDFSKTYGISEKKFNELAAYISIAPKEIKSKEKDLISIELNSADTLELTQIQGVGIYTAKEILRFRKKLGGFYDINQLKEIEKIRPENIEKIAPHCTVDTSLIQKLRINAIGVEALKRHPYINFHQAKSIYEFRKVKGKIKNIDQLKKLPQFTPDDWERIGHYLSFD